ncbi:MAG: Hsp20/alpha crystallin family protein [Opitutaceae bacterium]|nr:Hsp20/alpha crystallin family protein [Opitutaceae bacterium]
MHTIIQPLPIPSRSRSPRPPQTTQFRQPNYDCREQPDAVKLTLYTPGVNPAAIEIEAAGPDLIVTARKPQIVRVNWQSLHLETAQRDYRLRLRLGRALDYAALQADFHDGVLTLTLPKRKPTSMAAQDLNVA